MDATSADRGHRASALRLAGLGGALALLASCSSVEIVRLQTGPPTVAQARSGEIVVAVQARCLGFYLATIGIPSCDLDDVLNGLLRETSRKLGAERLHAVRFEATPESGVWWLTKLLWFRGAKARALAVIPAEAKALERARPAGGPPIRPAPIVPASQPQPQPGSRPASQPSSRPGSAGGAGPS